jgi:branched-chain amino acid transport system permease protein
MKYNRKNIISFFIILILLFIFPHFLKTNKLVLLTQMSIATVFALSYNILMGHTGLLSFGHAVYFGLGGYFTIHAMLLVNQGSLYIPTPLMPLVGAVLGFFLGIIIGRTTARRPGAVFAMISLGINEVVSSSALIFNQFFGSETGISARRESWLFLKFGAQIEVYYLILIWVLISILAMYFITTTPLGKIFNSLRDNPQRTQFIGYSPLTVRTIATGISGFFAGMAGGLYALNWELISYENVGIMQSAFVLFMVYIGGYRHFYGPIIGAIFVTFLNFYLSDFISSWSLIIGIVFIAIVLYAPDGLAGLIQKLISTKTYNNP